MTFRDWMLETIPGEVQNIVGHGADYGCPNLTYYKDTCAVYDKYEEEIWEALCEDADSLGYKNALAFIASFGGADQVSTGDTLKNMLAWYMAERTAQELAQTYENVSFNETTWHDNVKQLDRQAVCVSWGILRNEIFGSYDYDFRGTVAEEKTITQALLVAGAPEWVEWSEEGDTDEHGYYILGPVIEA